jgi:putative transposase
MSPSEKVDILARVENRSGCKRKVLAELGISRSTYYRWRQGQNEAKRRVRPWNRITPNEKRRTLAVALEFPELSSRQLSAWITDHEGFAVSESTVYRILRREGLVKHQEIQPEAAREYHTKDHTAAPDVGHRCFLFPRGWLGLLLPGNRDGRLLPLHPGMEAAERHVG